MRYIAGQFVDLYLPHQLCDARGASRLFTLISTPREPLVGIAASFPVPSSSFKQALLALRPGDAASITGDALGDFVLPKDPTVPLVWMAGGIGIASFVGMGKELAAESQPRRITFFHSIRRPEDALFGETWQAAGLAPQLSLTGTAAHWGDRRGRFLPDDLLHDANSSTLFYISGSDSMVEEVCAGLAAKGINREQLVREAYTGY